MTGNLSKISFYITYDAVRGTEEVSTGFFDGSCCKACGSSGCGICVGS